jgi:DNA-binding NarL/FixJ family response regulator
LRAAAIRQAGIRAAIAIPAVAADETLAVLEFFSLERIEPTERLLRALNGIGHEVGYFLGQRRGELVAPVLTPPEVQVLQLAAHATSAAAIAREMRLSPATVKRHFERAYAKLGVSDRAAAVAQAMRQGFIT